LTSGISTNVDWVEGEIERDATPVLLAIVDPKGQAFTDNATVVITR